MDTPGTSQFCPIAALSRPCKVCAGPAVLFGVVDFHKSGDELRQAPLPLSGIPIYYYRCPACGFLFTTAFDTFSDDDFRRHIYNEGYARVDPDYADLRPRGNAQMLAGMFPQARNLRVLDYGGGNGRLAQYLSQRGF